MSGIYFYKLQAGSYTSVKKMCIVIKNAGPNQSLKRDVATADASKLQILL